MKRTLSLLTNLLLSSSLLWGVSAAGAQEILRVPAESSGYCHMKFPTIREDTLFSANPVLNDSAASVDFYGSCDHDPLGMDEIRTQKEMLLRGSLADGE
jgi:hypothetical protein